MRTVAISLLVFFLASDLSGESSVLIRQITFGPRNHFFGYIGHVRTIPWNQNGRYIVSLETDFQNRMPRAVDSARIVLIDTQKDFVLRALDETRAWNPQQGTMLYWNPRAAETQFFFNDRDPRTGKIFTVLFDISAEGGGRRVREYRFEDTPVGNSGVSQKGGHFLAINYGRLARLRPVTGYADAYDWTVGQKHPARDGVFKIDVQTGEKQLLVSFKQLADTLRADRPDVDQRALFINHTLWNREGDRIFFFARADFADREKRINMAFTIRPNGTGLTPLRHHIGGHPEWDEGSRMIGAIGNRQILYDVDRQEVVGTLGDSGIFPNPEGDIALSPDGRWFVNGYGEAERNIYVFFRRFDGFHLRTGGVYKNGWVSGDLRLDPAPCWNRDGTAIVVPGIANDAQKTRQMFLIQLAN